MSEADQSVHPAAPGQALVRYADARANVEWADLRPAAAWARRHRVLLAALVLIVIQVALKAQFVSHLFFRQDDFHDLDLAVKSPLNWGYLTYIGSGHLIIGLRVIAWFSARISLYSWGLASAISLAFVLATGLAALKLLRTLFGERPAILIPLTFYLAVPLTLPDLGDWSSAMESVPLQLAILMAVSSHVLYLRTGRRKHLAAAAGWFAFGLLFFEKGMLLPFLLLALTGGFLAGPTSWARGTWLALRRHWRVWLVYGALDAGYAILLAVSLETSASQPTAPGSFSHVTAFVTGLASKTLLPGLVGGPWRWYPLPGNSFAITAAPALLIWLAAIVVAIVVAGSIWLRPIAWRAWAILAGWIVLADMLPVVIGRLAGLSAVLLALESRYVADAMPVAALCLGLAFLPVAGQSGAPAGRPRRPLPDPAWEQGWRPAVAALVGLFVFGSFWSAQAYESVTTGAPTATYIGHAVQAVKQAPRGTPVFNEAVPGDMVEGLFGSYALQSTVLGDIAPGKLRWIRHPAGTIDGLRMFGPDGRLYQAFVYGAPSLPRPAGKSCWPIRHDQVVIKLFRPGPPFSGILRIGYLWLPKAAGQVTVQYGTIVRGLSLRYGLHTAYVPVTGSASAVVIGDLTGPGLCVGDAEVGNLRPAPFGEVLPHVTAATPAA